MQPNDQENNNPQPLGAPEVTPNTDNKQTVPTENTPEVSAPVVSEPTEATSVSAEQQANTEPVVDVQAPASLQVEQPAAIPAQPIDQSAGGADKPGKKKKLVIIAGIVAALLVLMGGVAGAYFGFVLPNQPNKIVQDAFTNTLDEDKMKAFTLEGAVDFEGGEVSKVVSGVNFELKADTEAEAADLNLTLRTAVARIGLDVRTVDGESLYLRLSGLDGLDTLLASLAGSDSSSQLSAVGQFAPLLKQLNDNWYVVDESLLKQFSQSGTPVSDELDPEELEKIGEIYKKHQFISVDKKLADQDIHGVASHHLQVKIDTDKLVAFMEEVKAANLDSFKLKQEDIDSIKKVDFSKYPVDMWVAKSGRYLTQIALTVEADDTKYKVRVSMKDYNKPVKIEKPENAKSVLELVSQVMPLFQGPSSSLGL